MAVVPGGFPLGDEALDAYNETVSAAILQAIHEGGADAAMEFLTALADEFGQDVHEYAAELMRGR